MESAQRLIGNQVFAAMADADFETLEPHAVPCALGRNFLVNEADTDIDTVYFPTSAVLSVVSIMEDGEGVETCTVGRENAYGIANALGSAWTGERVICQIPGICFQVPLARLKWAAAQSSSLTELLVRQFQASSALTGQSAACNAVHPVEARLCRWLLMSLDRAGDGMLPLTHEYIGFMLGVQRTTVTIAARALQAAGLIRYKRGNIQIIDRRGLEHGACECYQAVLQKHRRILNKFPALR